MVLVALVLSLASCASSVRVYVNPQADLAFYNKIAVLPFTDMSPTANVGARVTRAFVTELIMANRFQIVQPEEFVGSLTRARIYRGPDGSYELDKLREACTPMGVTGILRGAVTECEMAHRSNGDIPVLAFDAELVDVNTGDVVWRSAISKRGKGRLPVFGGGSRSLGRLTQEACAEMVGRLRGKALR